MITIDPFRGQPVLHGASIRLEPLTTAVLADYLRALREPEVIRLTGSHSRFEPLSVEEWLRTRLDHHDRGLGSRPRHGRGVPRRGRAQ